MAGPVVVRHRRQVSVDPTRAYEVVADVRRRPQWLAELSDVDAPDGPVTLGDRFRGRSSILLHTFAGESEVIEADAGRVLAERVTLGATFTSRWTFEPTSAAVGGGGCTVTHEVAIDFPDGPLGRLERWVLRRRLSAMQQSSLAALGRLLR